MNDKRFLTIFTPTYNRAHLLGALYESLVNQSVQTFEWLIVDDGSEDGTKELVDRWIGEGKIPIRYHYQENGGKMRAHNTGVELCATEVFCCVDSDDYLVPDAIETIALGWNAIKEDRSIGGVVTIKRARGSSESRFTLPDGQVVATIRELYRTYRFDGEALMAHRIELLRRFPFDVEEGEKFLSEGYVYARIDQLVPMLVLDTVTLVYEYMEDGYTKGIERVIYNNPKSYMKHKKLMMELAGTPSERFVAGVALMSAYFILKRRHRNFRWSFWTLSAFFPGYLVYLRRFRRFARIGSEAVT